MKAGLTSSIVLHAALLGFGLLSLSAPAPMQVADVEALPIDIVPIEELTQIQQGDKTAALSDRPAPQPTQRPDPVPEALNFGENSVDTDKAPTPEPRPVPVQTASVPEPSPEPAVKPEPKAEDLPKTEPEPAPTSEVAPVPLPRQEVKPDPVKEAKPEPVKQPEPVKKAEPKPEPVKQPEPVKKAEPKPEPVKQPEAKTAEKAVEPVQEEAKPDAVAETIVAEAAAEPAEPTETVRLPNSAPAPAARPSPPQAQTAQTPERKNADKPAQAAASRPQSTEKPFDADEVAALLDKQKLSGGGAKRSREQAALGGRKTTGGDKLSQNEMDALRQKLGGCWSIPAGVDDADLLKVSVRFRLEPSGELQARPEVISGGASSGPGRTAAESAIRAVQKCAPFNLPADKYDTWSEVVVNFDPSDMY
jgi:colicin import membrane protein